jgi:ubiquitin-protein ligase
VLQSHLHHDLTQNLKNSQSNNGRQQATSPHYIRPAELPGEFRTIELLRAASFVTAPSTMAAPSIRLQQLDSSSLTEASRGAERGAERSGTEAFTESGSILEVIGPVHDYEELDIPGNTGNKSIYFKDPGTATISNSTTIRHSVLCNYLNANEGDEVPSNPHPVNVEEMAHRIRMTDIIATNQQANREILACTVQRKWPIGTYAITKKWATLFGPVQLAKSDPYSKRLLKELIRESEASTSLSDWLFDWCTYTPIFEKNMYDLIATIRGPSDTVYAGGFFHIRIHLSEDYPWMPGTWAFVTKVYHPNIGPDGSICVDLFTHSWSPAYSISGVLLALASFLGTPKADDLHPDSLEIASEYLNNRTRFDKTAIEWTKKYATGEITSENITKTFQKEACHAPTVL